MIKNILIISSDYTGHGHKSITESLCEKFSEHEDINVHIVDGFSLGGKALIRIGKAYGPITRNAQDLWKLIYELSSIKPALIDEFIEMIIKERFVELLKKVKPDLILSVHANFNGSIINILEKLDIKIPVVTLIADLVSIYPLWADPRVDYILCPTQEAKQKCIEYGVSETKLKVTGFPVRSRFCDNRPVVFKSGDYDTSRPLKCLIMSGGEGSGNMGKIARILLNNFNSEIKIIAGRNETMKKKLEQSLGQVYGDRVKIYGFTQNVQDLMLTSDIAFTRGSPNVMMEAISCNVPIVITGSLPGQEEGNPYYAQEYNLGVVCTNSRNVKSTMTELLANNAERLKEIKRYQKSYSNPHIASDIVNFLLNIDNGSAEDLPDWHAKLTRIDKKSIIRLLKKKKASSIRLKKSKQNL